MKNIRLTFAIILLGIASSAQADLLSQLDELLLMPSFEQSFVEKDSFVLEFEEQTSIGLGSKYQSTCVVKSVKRGQALTQCGTVPDQPNFQETITADSWTGANGNSARLLLASIASYGYKLELKSLDPTEIRLLVHQSPQTLSAYSLKFTGLNAAGSRISGELVMSPDLAGRMQIFKRIERMGEPAAITRSWTLLKVNRSAH